MGEQKWIGTKWETESELEFILWFKYSLSLPKNFSQLHMSRPIVDYYIYLFKIYTYLCMQCWRLLYTTFFYPFAIHIYLSFSIERTKSTNKNLHKTLYKCLPYKKSFIIRNVSNAFVPLIFYIKDRIWYFLIYLLWG